MSPGVPSWSSAVGSKNLRGQRVADIDIDIDGVQSHSVDADAARAKLFGHPTDPKLQRDLAPPKEARPARRQNRVNGRYNDRFWLQLRQCGRQNPVRGQNIYVQHRATGGRIKIINGRR